jgi:hypothetical protein
MITWLLIERYGQRSAETESKHRSLQVIHLNPSAQIGALSASIALELSQPLAAIMMNIGLGRASTADHSERWLALVERFRAENRPSGGAVLRFTLPRLRPT